MIYLFFNTEQLAIKKKEYANMAREINQIKMEIDATRDFLDDQKLDRDAQGINILSKCYYKNMQSYFF